MSVDRVAGRLINQSKPGFVNIIGDTVKDNRVNELMDQPINSAAHSLVNQVQLYNGAQKVHFVKSSILALY